MRGLGDLGLLIGLLNGPVIGPVSGSSRLAAILPYFFGFWSGQLLCPVAHCLWGIGAISSSG